MKKWSGKLLVLIAVGLIFGFGGYQEAVKRDSIKINQLSSQISDLEKTKPSISAQAKAQTSYAEITPFKVKFPYGDKPAGLGYTDVNSSMVAFDSETLGDYANKLDPKNTCGPDSAPGPLGFLSKTTNLPLTDASADSDGLVARVGSDYYVFTRPKDCSKNTQVVAEQKKQVNLVISDLNDLQAN